MRLFGFTGIKRMGKGFLIFRLNSIYWIGFGESPIKGDE